MNSLVMIATDFDAFTVWDRANLWRYS
jgi:hypothetical protein